MVVREVPLRATPPFKTMSDYVNNHPDEFEGDEREYGEPLQFEYSAQIVCKNTGEVLAKISSLTQEGLEEEMGKSQWSDAEENYESELNSSNV